MKKPPYQAPEGLSRSHVSRLSILSVHLSVFLTLLFMGGGVSYAQQNEDAGAEKSRDDLEKVLDEDTKKPVIIFGASAAQRHVEQEKDHERVRHSSDGAKSIRTGSGETIVVPEKEPSVWETTSFEPLSPHSDQWVGHRPEFVMGMSFPQFDSAYAYEGADPGMWMALGYHYRFNQYVSLGLIMDMDFLFTGGLPHLYRDYSEDSAYSRDLGYDDAYAIGGRPALRLHFPWSITGRYGINVFAEASLGYRMLKFGGTLVHQDKDEGLDLLAEESGLPRTYDLEATENGPYASFGGGVDFYFLEYLGVGLIFRWAIPMSTHNVDEAQFTEIVNGGSREWVYRPTGEYTADGLDHEEYKNDLHDKVIRSLGSLTLPSLGARVIGRF